MLKFFVKIFELNGNVAGGVKFIRAESCKDRAEYDSKLDRYRTSLPPDQFASGDMQFS